MEYFNPTPKKGSQSKGKVISRRAFILTSFKLAFLATIVGRLFYMQIVKKNDYVIQSDKNRFRQWKTTPSRGLIVDRNNDILADNFQVFKLAIIPKETKSFEKTLNNLTKVIKITERQRNYFIKNYSKHNKFQPFVLDLNLSWNEFSKLNYYLQNNDGIQPFVSFERTYLYPKEFSHILGYVSEPNIQDLRKLQKNFIGVPNLKIGKTGLEKIFDNYLLGAPGTATYEVDAYGRRVKKVVHVDGEKGKVIKTTFDKELQIFAYNRLNSLSGSVVVMDMYGKILCCASYPSFNSNDFTYGISHEDYNKLKADEKRPLVNKALSSSYPPGSTIKMIVALSALENKIITKNFKHVCKGDVELYDQKYHCWKDKGHGVVDLTKAIKESCDIYFYEVARLLGIDRLKETANKFGLGEVVLENFHEEKNGLIPSTTWKKGALGKSWYIGETMISGIGQGYMKTTCIQLCTMMAQIANGGFKINPTFDENKKSEFGEKTVVSDDHLKVIKEALFLATNEPGGTSYSSRISGKLKMAGKTGTSQVRRITERQRELDLKNEDLPWKFRDHSLFVGYGPTSNPEYAISVIIDHGGAGSAVAAPIARDVMKKAFEINKKNNNAI